MANALAAQRCLEAGQTLYAGHAAYEVDLTQARDLQLLTTKPFIYVFNLDEDQLSDAALHASLRELVSPADCVFLDAKLEADLAELDPAEAERAAGVCRGEAVRAGGAGPGGVPHARACRPS